MTPEQAPKAKIIIDLDGDVQTYEGKEFLLIVLDDNGEGVNTATQSSIKFLKIVKDEIMDKLIDHAIVKHAKYKLADLFKKLFS